MKAMCIEKVNEGVYKGVLMCKSSESSALTSPKVTLEGNTVTLIDGSIVLEVDTNAQYILYNGAWYKNE